MPDIEISITCPVCNKSFKKMTSELTKGTVLKCPSCGETTTIQTDMFTNMLEEKEN
jgi:uncharacterized C2H2 Zn-finger protein